MTCSTTSMLYKPSNVGRQTSKPVGPYRTSRLTQSCAASGCSDAPGSLDRGQRALDEVIAAISEESLDGAVRVLPRALDAAASLSTPAERGRVVKKVGDPTLRELSVYDDRLLYRVREDSVVIRAFLHSARDFSKWRREQAPEL